MFQCGQATFRTLEGAYQAYRGAAFEAGYENLSGGQAWARGARRGLPHRPSAWGAVVAARFSDLPLFADAIAAHAGPFHVWHQEPRVARLLEVLYAQLRRGAIPIQAHLGLPSPDPSREPQ